MEKGRIYVDKDRGPSEWFGLFSHTSPEVIAGFSWHWKWQVIHSEVVINGDKINNYYNRRVATDKDLEKIAIILSKFDYRLTKNNNLESTINEIDEGTIAYKLRMDMSLSRAEKDYLIMLLLNK